MNSFRQIIDLWGEKPGPLAGDLDLPSKTVWAWRERDSIPAKFWIAVEKAAKDRGYEGVTVDQMARIAAHAPSGTGEAA